MASFSICSSSEKYSLLEQAQTMLVILAVVIVAEALMRVAVVVAVLRSVVVAVR